MPKKRDFLSEYADLFFRETPIFKYMSRCGRARKLMAQYRKVKGTRRPAFATAQPMFKGYGV